MLLINWLTKVTNDPVVQGASPVNVIGVGSNEDRRNGVPDFDEVSVELDSGHRRHMDVGDQSSRLIALPLPRRQRSSATWRLRQMQVRVVHGAIMSREGDGAEEALSSREQELRLLVETIPALVWRAGPEGNVELAAQLQATLNVIPAHTWYAAPSGGLTFVNKRTADYLGLPKDHPLRFGIDVGAQWDAHLPFVHPDDRAETQENWSTRLRTGEGREGSFRVRNAEGGHRWFLSRAEPLRASDGTILQWVGVNLDIDELKCAEQALRESERSSRSAIDGIAGLVSIMAPNGELETV